MTTDVRLDVFPGSNDDVRFYSRNDLNYIAQLKKHFQTTHWDVCDFLHPVFGKIPCFIHYRRIPEIYDVLEK